MKWLAAFALAVLVIAGCLSRTNDPEPAGGADVTLFPSAATKGEPFVTPDNWTITIHTLALRLQAIDTVYYDGGETGGGAGVSRIMAPLPQCHLRITGADEGQYAFVGVETSQDGFGNNPSGELPACGVDGETLARFNDIADDSAIGDPFPVAFVVVASARNADGRTLEVSFTGSAGSHSNTAVPVTIKRDFGVPISFPVNGELLFAPQDPTAVTFDEIAACDKDGDGKVTGAELSAQARSCEVQTFPTGDDDDTGGAAIGGTEQYCSTVLRDFSININGMFGQGATP